MDRQGLELIGVWQQLILDETGRLWNGGLYRVEWVGDHLAMVPETYDDATPGIVKSKGLFDVTFEGNRWEFRSDWENGHSGTFILNRTGDDLFEGHVYVNGRRWSKNRWQRIASASVRAALGQAPTSHFARDKGPSP